MPIANVASITAVIVRMVKLLSDLYGIPFERDRARAIVVGLMGGAMPTGLGAVTTSTLFYVVPGSGLIGLAVSSIAAVACTRSIGRIFVEHFESGSSLHDLPRAGENLIDIRPQTRGRPPNRPRRPVPAGRWPTDQDSRTGNDPTSRADSRASASYARALRSPPIFR